MSLRLYDTASRTVREFTPREVGQAGIYLCGVTVQSAPHVGHMRSAIAFDILRRWLAHTGHEVTFIRNVTDIDDKVLIKSAEAGRQWWDLGYANERALTHAYDAFGVLPPSYEPRATGHVPEIIELIETLIARGHAYAVGADVYFHVPSLPDYGALSHQRVDHVAPADDDGEPTAKRDPRDFALWKSYKSTEPESASWPSPWGRGRPGWHIECSAMAWKYLGTEFDIHGGGQELIFPHHENEIAQSHAAGHAFSRYWMHNALVNFAGEKMSKSIGNIVDIPTALSLARPVEVRYYLGAAHYRSTLDWSAEALSDAAVAYRRIEGFLQRAGAPPAGELPPPFVAAMDDDLAVPTALATVHDLVRVGNGALAEGSDATEIAASVRAALAVLGLDPFDPQWQSVGGADAHATIESLVALALQQRAAARDRRDFAAADAVRDQLKHAGVLIEDTPHGPRWTLADAG